MRHCRSRSLALLWRAARRRQGLPDQDRDLTSDFEGISWYLKITKVTKVLELD